MMRRWRDRLIDDHVDGAGIAAFRVLFGTLMCFAAVRFWAKGWIGSLYVDPALHFPFVPGLTALPSPWIYVHFAVMGVAALCLAVGLGTRYAAAVYFVLFTWAELVDKSLYLNHYYLVSLLAFLLIFVPSDHAFAVHKRPGPVRAWAYTLMRGQMALVYFFAGLAKLNADWLLRGEPLTTWLLSHAHLPWLGTLFGHPWTGLAMSWAGAAFDLTIWLALLWPKTRRWAYGIAVCFHVTVWLLFPIGVFSWVMLVSATLFFSPSWPRRHAPVERQTGSSATPAFVLVWIGLWLAAQTVVPLRHLAYPGPVNWTEEGFRFAWRVMLIEKTGAVDYRVVCGEQVIRVHPNLELPPHQAKALRTQPDMIWQYAQHLALLHACDGGTRPAVYADAWVSWNGRPAARIVDPAWDLAATPRTLGPSPFIVREIED